MSAMHQVLHGYRAGHRLLAKSAQGIDPADERLMLGLSDASGPRLGRDSGSYISGYPLAKSGYYAIARTWPATEELRPGCVWTHTILISLDSLKARDTFLEFLELFRRPVSQEFESYASPVWLPARLSSRRSQRRIDAPQEVEAILETFYSTDDAVVATVASEDEILDSLPLLILEQLWPEARPGFSFCTGALTPRFLGSHPFVLQFVPAKAVRNWSARKLEFEEVHVKGRAAQWASVLTRDLLDQAIVFRQFTRDFGPPDTSRARMAHLASLYFYASAGGSAIKVLEALKNLGWDRRTGDLAKRILSPPGQRPSFVKLQEGDIIEALLNAGRGLEFSPALLDLRERARQWRMQNPSDARRLLEYAPLERSAVSSAVVAGFLDGLPARQLMLMVERRQDLLEYAVAGNPRVVESPALWRLPLEQQERVWTAVATLDYDRAATARAMLDAGSRVGARTLINTAPQEVIPVLMDWWRESGVKPTESWVAAAAEHHRELLAWLRGTSPPPCVGQVAFLLEVVEFSEFTRGGLGTSWWRRVGEVIDQIERGGIADYAASLLWIVSAQRPSDGAELIAPAFRRLHSRAAQGVLDDRAWNLVESVLPSMGFFESWDRCEQLRRGIVELFFKNAWSPRCFLTLTDDSLTFEFLVAGAKKSLGRSFLAEVRRLAGRSDPRWKALSGVVDGKRKKRGQTKKGKN